MGYAYGFRNVSSHLTQLITLVDGAVGAVQFADSQAFADVGRHGRDIHLAVGRERLAEMVEKQWQLVSQGERADRGRRRQFLQASLY